MALTQFQLKDSKFPPNTCYESAAAQWTSDRFNGWPACWPAWCIFRTGIAHGFALLHLCALQPILNSAWLLMFHCALCVCLFSLVMHRSYRCTGSHGLVFLCPPACCRQPFCNRRHAANPKSLRHNTVNALPADLPTSGSPVTCHRTLNILGNDSRGRFFRSFHPRWLPNTHTHSHRKRFGIIGLFYTHRTRTQKHSPYDSMYINDPAAKL